MIRKAIISALVFLATGLMLACLASEHYLSFRLTESLQLRHGYVVYRPTGWPLTSIDSWVTLSFDGIAAQWVTLESTTPKRSHRTERCSWIDTVRIDPSGTPCRTRSILIQAPLVPLTAAVLLAYPVAAFMLGPYRRFERRVKGLCLECGYQLAGTSSGRCPECGLGLDVQARMRDINRRWTRRLSHVTLALIVGLGCWDVLSGLEHIQAAEYYLESPREALWPVAAALLVLTALWLRGRRLKAQPPRRSTAPLQSSTGLADVRSFLLLLTVGWAATARFTGLPYWAPALLVAFLYLPPAARRRAAIRRLHRRPPAALASEYQEVAQRSGMNPTEVAGVWAELATYYRISPERFRAGDSLASLLGILAHPDDRLCGLDPRIPGGTRAEALLSGLHDWADLIIAVHAVRHGCAQPV